jgi:hypothetical protein
VYRIAGVGVWAPGSGVQQYIAASFVPLANADVTEIKVGITNVTGANGVTLSLNVDNGSLPGPAIYTWKLTNLPTSGCCTLDVAKDVAGLPVTKGTRYWVVAQATENTQDIWHNNSQWTKAPYAYDVGQGWQLQKDVVPALGVFGRQTQ